MLSTLRKYALTFLACLPFFNTGCTDKTEPLHFTGKTAAGYDYVHHIQRDGPKPQNGDRIRYTRQIRLGRDSVIAGFRELTILIPDPIQVPTPVPADYDALFLMAAGDSLSVYVTGDKLMAMPNVIRQPGDTLIFDMVLREIVETKAQIDARRNPAEDAMNRAVQGARAYKDGLLGGTLQSTESGLQYMFFSAGQGAAPVSAQKATLHYYGVTEKGDRIDDTYSKGAPFEFELGRNQVMPGMEEGIQLLKPGGSALLVIPAELAYGEMGLRGLVEPNMTVLYFVELLAVSN